MLEGCQGQSWMNSPSQRLLDITSISLGSNSGHPPTLRCIQVEWFQLEVIYSDHKVQLSDYLGAITKLKYIIKGIIQIHRQAQGINHLSRKFDLVSNYPLSERLFPNVQCEPPVMQLCAIPMCHVTKYQAEETSTSLSTSLLVKS